MARTTPLVEGSSLVSGAGDAGTIAIGTLAWYAWLEEATTFAVATMGGTFTARKERIARWRLLESLSQARRQGA